MLTGLVRFGTATAAALSGVVVAGKTGTTSNYGDAWFVGWTPQMTTAVWVGYPNRLVSMANDFNGGPVEGGTYPAIIWHNFMAQALQILAAEAPAKKSRDGTTTTDTTGSTLSPSVPSSGSTSATTTPSATTPAGAGGGATATRQRHRCDRDAVTAARAVRPAAAAEPRAVAAGRPVAAAEPRAVAVARPVAAAALPAGAVAPAAVPAVVEPAAPGSVAAAARLRRPASARDRICGRVY